MFNRLFRRNDRTSSGAVMIAIVMFGLGASALDAQTIWQEQSRPKSLWLEVMRPSLDGNDGLTAASTAWFAGARFPVSSNLNAVVELPFAYGNIGGDVTTPIEQDNATIGNPYLGIEWTPSSSSFFIEAGARAPLASNSDEALNLGVLVGLFSEIGYRAEAFVPEIIPVSAWANYLHRWENGALIRLRAGPGVWFSTDGLDTTTTEGVASYSGQIGYEGSRFGLLGGYVGWAMFTEDTRAIHHLATSANVNMGRVRPSVHLRVPILEGDNDVRDFVLGLGLGVRLK